jgi:hypothetical protein
MAGSGAIQATTLASASLAPQSCEGRRAANTSLAMMVSAADPRLAVVAAAAWSPTGSPTDRSLTYLRTARLRL